MKIKKLRLLILDSANLLIKNKKFLHFVELLRKISFKKFLKLTLNIKFKS